MRVVVPAFLIGQLLACSAASFDKDADTATGVDSDNDFDSDQDSDVVPVTGTWGLGGRLIVAAGAVELGSALEVEQRTADGSCVQPALIEGAVTVDTTASAMFAGFEITFGLGEDLCGFQGPLVVQLGLGPSDPLLQPVADRDGVSLSTSYGLYVLQGSTWALVGVAGTANNFAGVDPAVTAPPVPDGTFRLITAFGVDLVDP